MRAMSNPSDTDGIEGSICCSPEPLAGIEFVDTATAGRVVSSDVGFAGTCSSCTASWSNRICASGKVLNVFLDENIVQFPTGFY